MVLYLEMAGHRHGDRTLLSWASVAPVRLRLYCYHGKSAKTYVQTHLTTGLTYDSMYTNTTHLYIHHSFYHVQRARKYDTMENLLITNGSMHISWHKRMIKKVSYTIPVFYCNQTPY